MFRTTALTLAISVGMAGTVFAGPQYLDRTGYAVSGYDVVSYFDLTQAEIGGEQPAPLAGKAEFTADYNDATFAFASKENRARFQADPAAYVPQYDGHCAYGVAVGSKVPGNPNLWRIIDNKLYLNITEDVVDTWEEDIPGYLDTSEEEWAGLEAEKASRGRIPGFQSQAPAEN
ncbi:YHS domain-containing (seleno)protein [Paracoccus sp. JM45]|uniref:YHS domain-containing (seleno)protein n=1 Tax=Paracoccus sp. JM45 TaxID=2283626 RepID=UPI000E6CE3BF|nr:YHS domain-containing (seleno)protein [Paracoccus sp. JM45]RJE79635.1 YHS domain-containing protein [Paracoccus sp. JM45]